MWANDRFVSGDSMHPHYNASDAAKSRLEKLPTDARCSSRRKF
jgi:hypothetical protein